MGEKITRRQFLGKADRYGRLLPGVGPAYGIARDTVDSLRNRELRVSPWTVAGVLEHTPLALPACEPETEETVRLESLIEHPETHEGNVVETSGHSTFEVEQGERRLCILTSVNGIPVYSRRDIATQTYRVSPTKDPDSKSILMARSVRGNCGHSNTVFDRLPTDLLHLKAKVQPFDTSDNPTHYLEYISHKKPE